MKLNSLILYTSTYRVGSSGNEKNETPDFFRMALLQPYAAHHMPPSLPDIIKPKF